ncbi:MAG: hypothetical protein CL421_03355 [Acidimicrobiaceae bacterium]|nr:hypothetical protein [Acidimicrobiaceae bacterium]|tara:strand:+ start:4563 stop:5141 length:579 start_codon:yes stop_codon:yes gene_type:complete
MGDKFERLRLTTSLAHLIKGSEIVFSCGDGEEYTASTHPSAEFTICEMRRLIASSACPSRPNFTKWIKDFRLQGAIEDSGGGIYRSTKNDANERWFSTTLRPEIVYEILNNSDIEGICPDPVDALITPDPVLGVTTVRISVNSDITEDVLDELVLIGYSGCLVKEISSTLETKSRCGFSTYQKNQNSISTDL